MLLEGVHIPPAVRSATLEGDLFDIFIENGRIASVNRSSNAIKNRASGFLLPAFADLHTHIDKTFVVESVGAAGGDLFAAIDRMAKHRALWTAHDIEARMQRALAQAYAAGTRALRTHLDWSEPEAPKALAVFEAMHAQWAGRVALQCVSLTLLDVFEDVTAGQAIAQQVAQINTRCGAGTALLGAFVYRNAALRAKLERVFALAREHGLALDFHVDEGLHADACGLHAIAQLALQHDMQGRVTCGHTCSLSVQPLAQAQATLALCAQAGIHLVALPTTNLYLQGSWSQTPVERGITRLKEAVASAVACSIATDNVADGFYPYGSYDLMESFGLAVQVAHLAPAQDWLNAITVNPARAMGLAWDGVIAEGCPADLVLLVATTGNELLSPAGRARRVMRNGIWL